MTKNDYLWKFVEDLEQLYLLSTSTYDRSQSGALFDALQRIADHVHGFPSSGSSNGIIYRFRAIPKEQNVIYKNAP